MRIKIVDGHFGYVRELHLFDGRFLVNDSNIYQHITGELTWMLHNAVESSKSSVLITDTNKMKSNKRSIQNAGLIPSWYKKYVQGIFKWQITFHLNSLELSLNPSIVFIQS